MNTNANSSPTRVEQWLKVATASLDKAGVGSARLDCLILLEDATGQDRAWVLAHPEHEISNETINKLNKQIARRAKHEPLAYIRGFSEFYGRRFKVNKHVLEPRPESETMIDLLKTIVANRQSPIASLRIADVGTGSGCLGITAALELNTQHVDLFDIDASALAVAKHNAVMHELHLRAEKRDLLRNSHTEYDAVLANLPYSPSHWQLHPSILMEPRIAFLGGKDGLDIYRRLFSQVQGFKHPPHYIFTESMPPQHEQLAKIAAACGYKLVKLQDFIQVFMRT